MVFLRKVLKLCMVLGVASKPAVQLQARHVTLGDASRSSASLSGNATRTSNQVFAPIYQLLVKEWKKIPELGAFTDRCFALISKLLPRLRYDYTSRNVPHVLINECDIYSTKEDYKTNNTEWSEARNNCRYSARRLGDEFLGDKDYKGWCTDLHAYLLEQQNLHIERAEHAKMLSDQDAMKKQLEELRKDYQEALRRKGQITAELEAMGGELNGSKKLPCCPAGCRICH